MDIEIRELTPDLADEYVRFFDETPHDDETDENKCYCVCWCGDDSEGKDFSSPEKRRACARRYVEDGSIRGYLAYNNGKAVGWCNANTRANCLKCHSWRRYMGHVPLEEADARTKIKSIFCFVIAPEMKRKGIATLLTERVSSDAAKDGFDFIEAYPKKNAASDAENFIGPLAMYLKNGFTVSYESEQKLIVRRPLKNLRQTP